MKVLHVMKMEKFTKGVVDFYETYFGNSGHEILYIIHSKEDPEIKKESHVPQHIITYHNAIQLWRELRRFANKYDYIVLHSLFFGNLIRLFMVLTPSFLRKTIWIEWGHDLYQWKRSGSNIKSVVINRINYIFRISLYGFVAIFPPDQEYYKKAFSKTKAKVYFAPYCSGHVPSEFLTYSVDSRLEKTLTEKGTIYIQVGHNAQRHLNHISVLKKLERFKKERIMLVLPISYGDADVKKEVTSYLEEHFPGKYICLHEFLPKEEYFELTKRVDIAIFDTDRQSGLANINRLIIRNVKLYLRDNSVMCDYFTEMGIPVARVSELQTCTFEEFVRPVKPQDGTKFADYIKGLGDMRAKVERWRRIYDELEQSTRRFKKEENR